MAAKIILIGILDRPNPFLLIGSESDIYFEQRCLPSIKNKNTLLVVQGLYNKKVVRSTNPEYKNYIQKISPCLSRSAYTPDIIGGDLVYKNLDKVLPDLLIQFQQLHEKKREEAKVSLDQGTRIEQGNFYLKTAQSHAGRYDQILVIAHLAITINLYKIHRLPHYLLIKSDPPADALLAALESEVTPQEFSGVFGNSDN